MIINDGLIAWKCFNKGMGAYLGSIPSYFVRNSKSGNMQYLPVIKNNKNLTSFTFSNWNLIEGMEKKTYIWGRKENSNWSVTLKRKIFQRVFILFKISLVGDQLNLNINTLIIYQLAYRFLQTPSHMQHYKLKKSLQIRKCKKG